MGDQSMRDYGLAVPHGPNMTGEHVATQDVGNMSGNEEAVFRSLLLPDDSYDRNGVYWADMNIAKRAAFVSKVDNSETAKEFASIGRMMKADPLSPLSFYFRNMVIPGAGLLLEGYVTNGLELVAPCLRSTNNATVTCFSLSATSSLCSRQGFRVAGASTPSVTKLGRRPSTTWRSAVSLWVRFSSALLVTGSDVAGV